MVRQLIKLIKELGYPVRRQGSMNEAEPLPTSFFTYFNSATDFESYLDNTATELEYTVDICFYSTDIELTYTILKELRQKLKENGWNCPSEGEDIGSDTTTHYGRMYTVYYTEMRN